jgi:hypothetical protein
MPIDRVSMGPNMYLFESPTTDTTQCVIVGHSGRFDEDGAKPVPSGVTITFYAEDGEVVQTTADRAVRSATLGINSAETVGQNELTWNYRVLKRGAHGDAVKYSDVKQAMEENQACGGNWQPHVVTIRNRKLSNRVVHLSEIVNKVKARYPAVTEIHFNGCREHLHNRNAVVPGMENVDL